MTAIAVGMHVYEAGQEMIARQVEDGFAHCRGQLRTDGRNAAALQPDTHIRHKSALQQNRRVDDEHSVSSV